MNALLRRTNLHEVRHRKLGTFSGGMKQRFGIAQALLGRPQLVIVDEPTAGLDPEERARFHGLLAEIGEEVIVILSTHIVADVSDLCPRMAIINQGRVVLTGEPTRSPRPCPGGCGASWSRGRSWTPGERSSGDRWPCCAPAGVAGRIAIHVHARAGRPTRPSSRDRARPRGRLLLGHQERGPRPDRRWPASTAAALPPPA